MVVALAVVLSVSAAVYRAYRERQEYKAHVVAAFVTADSRLRYTVARLDAAKRTAEVRAAAQDAAATSDTLGEMLPDLGDEEAARARSVQEALDSVGALVVLNADSLNQWRELRPTMAESLDAVMDESSQVVGVPGSTEAIASVDKIVTRGRAKLAAWKQRSAQARADQRADLAAFDSYVDEMEAQAKTYNSMRDETAAQIDAMRNDSSNTYYFEPTRELFSNAMQDRVAVRDVMNGPYVPAELRAQHDRLVGVLNDGIGGMSQLLGALDDNQACYGDCFLFDQPLWADFQASSDSVSEHYRAAYNAWVASLDGARAGIEDRPMPQKPVV